MLSSKVYWLGIDVSKKTLQLHSNLLNFKLPARIDNEPAAIRALIKSLLKCRCLGGRNLPRLHVICEPTGRLEVPLLEILWELNIPVSLVNPKWVRRYIQGCGIACKTDAVDARMIWQYGHERQPAPMAAPSPQERELRNLVSRRNQLICMVREQKCQLLGLRGALADDCKALITNIKAQIKKIEKSLQKVAATCPLITQKLTAMQQVKGVGFLTAVSLLALVPELGQLNRNQAAALLGVAPMNADSGQFKGQRFIQGGRANARATLYMAALTAARSNQVFRDFYNRLTAKGKASKVALTAVMNKLIKTLNSILKNPNFTLLPQ